MTTKYGFILKVNRSNAAHRASGLCTRAAAILSGHRISHAIAVCGVLVASSQLQAQVKVEKVDHLPSVKSIEVHAIGRVEHSSKDKMYKYQWPGIYFLAAYQGSALYFKVDGGNQDLHLWVDGHTLEPLTKAAPGVYRIANSDAGNHAVRIDVVNENQDGPKTLGDFSVEAGGHEIPFPANGRQIEFIGDSHTVGYGNTSTTRTCSADQIWTSTDTSRSVGADTALHYNADYQINAISGHGAIRNFSGGPGDPVPVAYPFVLLDKQTKYNDPAWHPSAIVISLGTNDFSTALLPGEPWKTRDELHTAFEQAFVDFLKSLRVRNPRALIVLWSTNMSNGEIAAESQKVVHKMRASGDKRVDFVEVSGLSFTGCDWHPSASDDLVVSRKLIEDIDKHKDVWP